MGIIAVHNQRCINPECGSSDAMQIYTDGSAYCFSCQKYFSEVEMKRLAGNTIELPAKAPQPKKTYSQTVSFSVEEIMKLNTGAITARKIPKEVADFYGVKMAFNEDGTDAIHYYPYDHNKAFNVREVATKSFHWVGNSDKLFGQDKFPASGKRVIICEGEIDALSMAAASYQQYKKFYPIVGLPSVSRVKTIISQRAWLREFDEILLCMDSDDPGQEAQMKFAKMLGADKVRLVKLARKDCNEVLVNDGPKTLLTAVWDAERYIPSGILTRDQLWEHLVAYNEIEAFPYPPCFEGINKKLKGMRGGEIVMLVSGTGSGKSTIFREIILHILSQTKENIGIMSLEESPAETTKRLCAMALRKNPAIQEISLDELKKGFDIVFGEDRIMLLDHQGSIGDESIMDKMEYMALMGCKKLFLDHITILTSEGIDDLRGNEAQDKVMSDFLKFVKRYPDVWLGLIAHLRKTSSDTKGKSFEEGKLPTLDDIKGSGALKQIPFDIIAAARNLNAETEEERNTVHMAVLKARVTGMTGPVADTYYDGKTGRFITPNFNITSV